MSICDAVQEIISSQENFPFDINVCRMYEDADKSFQELVDRGVAYKRGCQLLPMESKICNNVNFNTRNA